MSDATDSERAVMAAIWTRPRRRVDLATILEVHGRKFGITIFCAVVGVLSIVLGTVASLAGSVTNSQGKAPIGFVVGVIALLVAAYTAFTMFFGGKHYRDARDFATQVFEHIFAKPSGPNMHLFERVALPGSVGAPGTDSATAIREWVAAQQQAIAGALVAAAGLSEEAQLYQVAPVTTATGVAGQLTGDAGELVLGDARVVDLPDAQATVWDARQTITFRFVPVAAFGTLSEDGNKLADARVAAEIRAVVTVNPAGDWYVARIESQLAS